MPRTDGSVGKQIDLFEVFLWFSQSEKIFWGSISKCLNLYDFLMCLNIFRLLGKHCSVTAIRLANRQSHISLATCSSSWLWVPPIFTKLDRAVILSIFKWIAVTNLPLVRVNVASFTVMSSSILIYFVISWYDQVPPVVVPWQTAPNLFRKHLFGLLTVAFLYSVTFRSEEVNSPSTTPSLSVTVGLILF